MIELLVSTMISEAFVHILNPENTTICRVKLYLTPHQGWSPRRFQALFNRRNFASGAVNTSKYHLELVLSKVK